MSYYKAIVAAQEKNLKTFSTIQSSNANVLTSNPNLKSESFISIPKTNESAMEAVEQGAMDAVEEVDAEGRRKDGVLIFNDTTEFTSRLRARLTEKARVKAEVAIKDQERMEMPMKMDEGDDAGSEGMDEDAMDYLEDNEHKQEDNGAVSESDQLEFLHKQPLVSQGMAATLALLKQSSHANETETLIGRARDNRAVDPSAKLDPNAGDKQFDVKIEYRDNLGRKLTQKDAFRQICYKFHGYGPSKKKLEKRAKEIDIANKNKTVDLSVSGTMKSFTQTQEASGKAHVVIQVC